MYKQAMGRMNATNEEGEDEQKSQETDKTRGEHFRAASAVKKLLVQTLKFLNFYL